MSKSESSEPRSAGGGIRTAIVREPLRISTDTSDDGEADGEQAHGVRVGLWKAPDVSSDRFVRLTENGGTLDSIEVER